MINNLEKLINKDVGRLVFSPLGMWSSLKQLSWETIKLLYAISKKQVKVNLTYYKLPERTITYRYKLPQTKIDKQINRTPTIVKANNTYYLQHL